MPTVRALPASAHGASRYAESPYYEEAQAGARTLDRQSEERFRQDQLAHQQRMEALAQERESRLMRLQEVHQSVQNAIEARKTKEAELAASRREMLETEMQAAVQTLHLINPKDPDARKKVADVYSRWPDLFVGRKGDPYLEPQTASVIKSIEGNETSAQKAAEKSGIPAVQDALLSNLPDGFKADEIRRDGVTLKRDQQKAGLTPERRQQLHEKQIEYLDKQLSGIENAVVKPAWLNSTGPTKDDKGVMRFGFADKQFPSESPVASPADIRQWKAYNDLKENYDLHQKALADLRSSELAGGDSTVKTQTPPPIDKAAVDADKTALAGLSTNPNLPPEDNPTAPTPSAPPAGVVTPIPPNQPDPRHAAALEWAKANPDDPRSKTILDTASAAIAQ